MAIDTTLEALPPLPSLAAIQPLTELLRDRNYRVLQFAPSRHHSPLHLKQELPRLVEQEQRLLESVGRGDPILYEHSLAPDYYDEAQGLTPAQTLLRDFFLAGKAVSQARMKSELPEFLAPIDGLVLHLDGELMQFPYRIVPVYDLLLLADWESHNSQNRVFLFRDSCLLAAHIRSRASSLGVVADVGCGSGVLGLTAVAHGAERAVSVDINPRAVACSRLNAALNGLTDRVDVQLGSIDEALSKQPEHIFSNPPTAFTDKTGKAESGLCVDGGDYAGMGVGLQFVDAAGRVGIPITLFIPGSITESGNVFDNHLPSSVEVVRSHFIELDTLYPQFASHKPALDHGIKARKWAIYELRPHQALG